MAGTSSGFACASLIGARVTRPCTYVPGYIKDGKAVSPKIYIPVAVNSRDGRVSYYNLTAWGDKITQLFANYLRKGKEMHFINARHTTYRWQMTNKDGQPLLENDGTPLMTDRSSYVVAEFIWGSDSNDIMLADEEQARLEVTNGLRGPNWRTMGHPDNLAWKAREKARVSQPYQGGPRYGHAEVSKRSLAFQASNAYVPVQSQAGVQNIPAGGTPPPPVTTIVSPGATTPAVGQVTYESLIAAGWIDAQIMADPRFAVLKTAHDAMMAAQANPLANTVQIPTGQPGGVIPNTGPGQVTLPQQFLPNQEASMELPGGSF